MQSIGFRLAGEENVLRLKKVDFLLFFAAQF